MTSPVDTSVKFFHSEMLGAPVLSGTEGALIAILDAVLVNGFNLKTPSSASITGNVVTMVFPSAHGFEVGSVIEVAGVNVAAINGEQRVTAVTSNNVSFATSGQTNQTLSGSITVKFAAAGWEKSFSGTNVAAYKSSDPSSTGLYLRVDDTTPRHCRVRGYETMSGIDTGTGPFPTDIQLNGGLYWSKSAYNDSNSRKWLVFSDGKCFYFARNYTYEYPYDYEVTGFGDILSKRVTGDPYGAFISGPNVYVAQQRPTGGNLYYQNAYSGNDNSIYMPRRSSNIGSSVPVAKSAGTFGIADFWSGYGNIPYPNPTDGGLYMSDVPLIENQTIVVRGTLPGFRVTPQNIPAQTFAAKDSFVGEDNRKYVAIPGAASVSQGICCFVDVTGPWR